MHKQNRIYGAFKSEASAEKVRKRHGAFIIKRMIRGQKRYIVTRKVDK